MHIMPNPLTRVIDRWGIERDQQHADSDGELADVAGATTASVLLLGTAVGSTAGVVAAFQALSGAVLYGLGCAIGFLGGISIAVAYLASAMVAGEVAAYRDPETQPPGPPDSEWDVPLAALDDTEDR